MKKLLTVAIATVISLASFSQSTGLEPMQFNVGLEAGMPMGDFKESHNFGVGLSAKVILSSGLTGSIGYVTFSGKDLPGFGKMPAFNTIPVKAGYRIKADGGFYFEPQVGITFMSSDGESMNAFTWAPNVGISTGPIDISVRYENISQSGENLNFLGLRLAYSFGGK